MPIDFKAVEQKWSRKWEEARIFESEPNAQEKFFILFAYPGISGFLHVGHMRGFTYADIIARYKRMLGYNVLFPAGFHATGLPSVSFAKKVERKDKETIEMLRAQNTDEKTISQLTNPEFVVNYFSNIYAERYWKRFGLSIDYRRCMTTISEGYRKFIQWQFMKLSQKKLLLQKEHYAPFCTNCGPIAVDPSETDISSGGTAEILEYTLLPFKTDDFVLPAATLRPETIFGVTNLWLNPNADYVEAKYKNKILILSAKAAEKISLQKEIEILNKHKGSDLVGKICIAPVTNKEIKIFPSDFVDPNMATGVVMSVPAHAPYDYIALEELKKDDVWGKDAKNIKPISIIKTVEKKQEETRHDVDETVSHFPESKYSAIEISKQLGITSIRETEKLNEATNIVYKKEFHSGVLKDNCGFYSGMRVADAKQKLQDDFFKNGVADIMLEFSETVVCRCGRTVFVKKIPDQWFIKYSDAVLKEKSKNHVKRMFIRPTEYQSEMTHILDWYGDRACIRQGSWLGTEFPFKKNWVIEPISDSTIYPAYYIISKYINSRELKLEDMDDAFFDYVFLNKGMKNRSKIAEKIREEFSYWYPPDINLGGKEHKTVHFPVFLMNHVALLPEKYFPKGIFVHWWVTQKKGKISKSKGGAEPIGEAADKYTVDCMRLYYAHVSSSNVDMEWDSETVLNYRTRVEKIYSLIDELGGMGEKEAEKLINRWLESKFHGRISNIMHLMDAYDLRATANEIYFEFYNDIKWYLRRGGRNKTLLSKIIPEWLKLMSPFTPFIAEELWEIIGNKGFVCSEKYPTTDIKKIDIRAENEEELIKNTISDISEILKVTEMKPKAIFIYTAENFKMSIYQKALEKAKAGCFDISILMHEIMKEKDMKKKANEVKQACLKIVENLRRKTPDEIASLAIIDEKSVLRSESEFIKKTFNVEKIEVYTTDEKPYDPKNKAKQAVPFRPAIYIE